MTPLHLIRLPVCLEELSRFATTRRIGWTPRKGRAGQVSGVSFDEGRVLHHLLSEMFGKGVLQPFRLLAAPGARTANLYAYAAACSDELREAAASYAMPDALAVCDPAGLQAKAMPQAWRAGQRLGFDIRIRPIRRLMKPLTQSDGSAFSKGAEVDAFLVEALRSFPAPGDGEGSMAESGRFRETVYAEWLAAQLGEAARLDAVPRLARFRRSRVARNGAGSDGPDATLHGTLTVGDPAIFAEKLAKGVGRHRAYGYGMLLLRPPGAAAMET